MRNTSKAKTAQASQETETVGVRFQSEMVVREDVVIPFTKDGRGTLGEMLDHHLASLANDGGVPRSFSFEFDGPAWEQAKPLYQEKYDEIRNGSLSRRDY